MYDLNDLNELKMFVKCVAVRFVSKSLRLVPLFGNMNYKYKFLNLNQVNH